MAVPAAGPVPVDFYYPGLAAPVRVIYLDNHLIAAVKPPGVLSQRDHTGDLDMLTILKAFLRERYAKPGNVFLGLVHRLDRPAGGVMVFARTSKAAARLSAQIRQRQVEKTYLAVVCGVPRSDSGRWTSVLQKDYRHNRTLSGGAVCPSGNNLGRPAEAALRYRVLGVRRPSAGSEPFSLLSIELETGRSHQIRVQTAERGMPIWGDARYGALTPAGRPELALWSYRYAFSHPTRPEPVELTARPPARPPWSAFEVPDKHASI